MEIRSVGQTKSRVKKETKGADGKVTVAFVSKITRYKVICGSKGRRLTDEEFVNMYPSQCNIFKEIFKEEFQVAYQKVYEKLKNKK